MRQNVPNDKAKLSPVAKVVAVFGEIRAAEIAGVGIDALRKWKRRKATGGKGGLVPDDYQHRYLDEAKALGLTLSPEDLIAEPY